MTNPDFRSSLIELADLARKVADGMGPDLDRAFQMVRATVDRHGTLLFCGNGGSAADAQHLATEYVDSLTLDHLRISHGGRVTPRLAARVALKALDALVANLRRSVQGRDDLAAPVRLRDRFGSG